MYSEDDVLNNLYESFFGESMEAGDKRVPDELESVVSALENKGYQVKYSSPGYSNTKFDNDRNDDRVINGKLVSTGRIIFSRKYDFPNTPKGWEWKVLENDVKALYVKPFTYNEEKGSKGEAFTKWKNFYMDSIKDWVSKLPQAGTKDPDVEEDKNFNK